MNKLLKTLFILIVCFQLTEAYGRSLFEINTGDSDSASWQFTLSLSKYWKMKYQDKSNYFAPRYEKSFYQRFVNLDRSDCKLIIAPLNSLTELPITDLDIKIAAVLWKVYLAPVDLQGENRKLSLESSATWYLPEQSLIMPHYLEQLRHLANDPLAIMDPDSKRFVQTVDWLYYNAETYDFQDNSVTDTVYLTENDLLQPGLPMLTDITSDSTGDSTTDAIDNIYEEEPPEVSPYIETYRYIETIDRLNLFSSVFKLNEGIVFFEMIGPVSNLMDHLGEQHKLLSLDSSFVQQLLRYNRYLEQFDFSRRNIKTVSVTFALFVHGTEDPEFVKELVELLDQLPRTYFPRDFIITNLSLKETKEISPLFLHEGSIDYFNLD